MAYLFDVIHFTFSVMYDDDDDDDDDDDKVDDDNNDDDVDDLMYLPSIFFILASCDRPSADQQTDRQSGL